MKTVQIELADGKVEGREEVNIRIFLSLPYAAPMTDERRFREPQPVEPWQGVRDATVRGPCAPQLGAPPQEIDLTGISAPLDASGPDYLTLNVWAPAAPRGPRPVMVFIHGGSFISGSKDVPAYDGSAFARDGVVCLTINYRVGIEGFLPIPGVPTNIGLRDMIAALAWVKANITAFGGDPDNVTLFGESGGAYCIAALMTSPLAQGLFRRAICQSGHAGASRDLSLMRGLAARVARRARVSLDRQGFVSRSAQDLLPAQAAVMAPSLLWDMRDDERRDPSFGITRFLPVHGDDVLPQPSFHALASGAGAAIDLLIGTNTDEANLFFAPAGGLEKLSSWVVWFFLSRAIPRSRKALAAYGLGQKGKRPGEVLSRAMTDLMFRWPARRMAELHGGRAHVYEFDWRSPALGERLGAAHAVELPFVFDTLACASGDDGLLGPNPPQALADSIHALWIAFATDGSLPWPAYESTNRQVYSLMQRAAAAEPVMAAAPFLH